MPSHVWGVELVGVSESAPRVRLRGVHRAHASTGYVSFTDVRLPRRAACCRIVLLVLLE